MTKPIPIPYCLDGKVVERSLMDQSVKAKPIPKGYRVDLSGLGNHGSLYDVNGVELFIPNSFKQSIKEFLESYENPKRNIR